MKRYRWLFCGGLLAAELLAAADVRAQTGNGLQGAYFAGHNFERYVLTQEDARLDFAWQQRSPTGGVPAEDFSVRWTGWLVPPATGRYVLHLVVDDGTRLWLNGRQLVDEWRGQAVMTYDVPLDLKAGESYALRLDYCQYGADSRMLLAWTLPATARPQPASSWRNGWGLLATEAPPEAIPTRYLFTTNPKSVALPVVAVRGRGRPAATPRRAATAPPGPRRQPVALVPRASRHAAATTDSASAAATVARLAAGQPLTLRALYFEQGKAYLNLAAQTSLDSLAAALRQRPGLRLEVQGHTDNQGDSALNRQLSQQRAEAVCQYLAAHGVAAARLQPVGYGGAQPIADNRLPAQRPRNRRVVLRALR